MSSPEITRQFQAPKEPFDDHKESQRHREPDDGVEGRSKFCSAGAVSLVVAIALAVGIPTESQETRMVMLNLAGGLHDLWKAVTA